MLFLPHATCAPSRQFRMLPAHKEDRMPAMSAARSSKPMRHPGLGGSGQTRRSATPWPCRGSMARPGREPGTPARRSEPRRDPRLGVQSTTPLAASAGIRAGICSPASPLLPATVDEPSRSPSRGRASGNHPRGGSPRPKIRSRNSQGLGGYADRCIPKPNCQCAVDEPGRNASPWTALGGTP